MEGSSSNLNLPRTSLQDISNTSEHHSAADVLPVLDDGRRKNSKLNQLPQPRKQLRSWTPEEDELLRAAVDQHKARNWKQIAAALPNRTDVQCLHRWQKVLNPDLVKGYWTKEEDVRLIELVALFGTQRWAGIARSLPGRNGKQCRERWCNHLDPHLKKEPWSQSEDLMLYLAHQRFGNKWANISKLLPGRSDNSVKNRWNTCVKKKTNELEEYIKLWYLQNPPEHQPAEEDEIKGECVSDGQLALTASEDLLTLSNNIDTYNSDNYGAEDSENFKVNLQKTTNISNFRHSI